MKLWQALLLKIGVRAASTATSEIKNKPAKKILKDSLDVVDLLAEVEASEKNENPRSSK
jgi:hypothetical protein